MSTRQGHRGSSARQHAKARGRRDHLAAVVRRMLATYGAQSLDELAEYCTEADRVALEGALEHLASVGAVALGADGRYAGLGG